MEIDVWHSCIISVLWFACLLESVYQLDALQIAWISILTLYLPGMEHACLTGVLIRPQYALSSWSLHNLLKSSSSWKTLVIFLLKLKRWKRRIILYVANWYPPKVGSCVVSYWDELLKWFLVACKILNCLFLVQFNLYYVIVSLYYEINYKACCYTMCPSETNYALFCRTIWIINFNR